MKFSQWLKEQKVLNEARKNSLGLESNIKKDVGTDWIFKNLKPNKLAGTGKDIKSFIGKNLKITDEKVAEKLRNLFRSQKDPKLSGGLLQYKYVSDKGNIEETLKLHTKEHKIILNGFVTISYVWIKK